MLLFYQRLSGSELPAALVEISKSGKDSGLQVKVPQFGAALQGPTIKLAQATPAMMHLVLELTVQSMGPNQQPIQQSKSLDVLVEFHDGYAGKPVRPIG